LRRAVTVGRVVGTSTLFRLKPEGLQASLVAAHLGRQDATDAHRLATVAVEALVDQRKAVALAQVAMKIDLAAKNGDQLAGDGFGYAGFVGGGDPGAGDLGRLDDGAALPVPSACSRIDEVLAALRSMTSIASLPVKGTERVCNSPPGARPRP
jgi:hypothetical protein